MKFRFEEPAPLRRGGGGCFSIIPFRDDSGYQIPPLKGVRGMFLSYLFPAFFCSVSNIVISNARKTSLRLPFTNQQ